MGMGSVEVGGWMDVCWQISRLHGVYKGFGFVFGAENTTCLASDTVSRISGLPDLLRLVFRFLPSLLAWGLLNTL